MDALAEVWARRGRRWQGPRWAVSCFRGWFLIPPSLLRPCSIAKLPYEIRLVKRGDVHSCLVDYPLSEVFQLTAQDFVDFELGIPLLVQIQDEASKPLSYTRYNHRSVGVILVRP